jgi:hypothetical protein
MPGGPPSTSGSPSPFRPGGPRHRAGALGILALVLAGVRWGGAAAREREPGGALGPPTRAYTLYFVSAASWWRAARGGRQASSSAQLTAVTEMLAGSLWQRSGGAGRCASGLFVGENGLVTSISRWCSATGWAAWRASTRPWRLCAA